MKKLIVIKLLLYTALAVATLAGAYGPTGIFGPSQNWVCIKPYMADFCVEIRPKEPFATKTPWQLPKPGDKLYDASCEEAIKRQDPDPKS